MTTQQQAYIEGFVKRASEYGFSEAEAFNILKAASELKGNQHKLDVDKDGKIEAEDLRKLRQRKQAAELVGKQHKLDVDKDGKIEASDLRKLRQRKQAADSAPLTAPGTPDTNIMNSLKGLMSSGSSAVTPAQATVPAAPAATMNDRILKALGMAPTGIPASAAGAYGGVLRKNPQVGGAKSAPAPR